MTDDDEPAPTEPATPPTPPTPRRRAVALDVEIGPPTAIAQRPGDPAPLDEGLAGLMVALWRAGAWVPAAPANENAQAAPPAAP